MGGLQLASDVPVTTGSGLWTMVVIGRGLSGGMYPGETLSALPTPLLVGGIPFLTGLGLFVIGCNLSCAQ